MDNWLKDAKELADSNTPFVLATIWKKSGFSPDDVGSRLLITRNTVSGNIISTRRRELITDRALRLLCSGSQGTLEQYPLGEILGTENGRYEVLFIQFQCKDTPQWLELSCQLQEAGDKFVLGQHVHFNNGEISSCEFQVLSAADETSQAINDHVQQLLKSVPAVKSKLLVTTQEQQTLLQLIREPGISVAVLGSGNVATCLVEQLSLLPVHTHWFAQNFSHDTAGKVTRAPLNELLFDSLANNTRVVISTGRHESDLRYCELATQSERVSYVGCIGSEKKAEIIKHSLHQANVPFSRIDQLHIPIGMAGIEGKHPAIVAASIVAQLLAFRD